MACERYADQIRELVERALASETRRDLDAHLAGCPGCRDLVRDLTRIGELASSLERVPPPAAAWAGIRRQLDQERAKRAAGRRWTPGWRWMAAAAVLVGVAVPAIYLFRMAPGPTGRRLPAAASRASAAVESVEAELKLAEEHYENAIAGLERIARGGQDALDPQVAETLRKNLAVIDRAIEESRIALGDQPDSAPAQESLFEALRRKVGLLQDTIALMNEMRKGNQEGAARIAEGLNKS
jgi:hypothetical protein